MRPKLATHLSPAESISALNVTGTALNVTSTTQRRAAAPVTLLAPEVDEAGSLSECEAKFAASCAGQATCCYLCFPDGTIPTGSECLFDPAACVYCYRCAPSCARPTAVAAAAPPAAAAGRRRSATAARRPGGPPSRRRRPSSATRRSSARAATSSTGSGAARGDSGSAAAASFVLTTTLTPSHNASLSRQQKAYAQLEHCWRRTVYLVENQHGRSCCKTAA